MCSDEAQTASQFTQAVHGGEDRIKFAKSLVNPIAQTATYIFEDLDEVDAYIASGEERAFRIR